MLRSPNQTRAAERSSVGYVNRSYVLDGVLWRFWSMAPGRKDHHWVTDGARFVLATDAGLLDVRDPRWHVHRTLEELKDQASGKELALRMADDQFTGRGYETPSCLVVPATSVGSPAQHAAALKQHQLNGRFALTTEEILAEGRRQLAGRRQQRAA